MLVFFYLVCVLSFLDGHLIAVYYKYGNMDLKDMTLEMLFN